jgi:hypothetical protein
VRFLKERKASGEAMLVADTGDHFHRELVRESLEVEQAERKARLLAAGAKAAGYDVVCPGEADLAAGWLAYLDLCRAAGLTPIAANLTIAGQPALAATAIREAAGIKLGFLGLFRSDRTLPALDGKPIQVLDATAAARDAVRFLSGKVDVVVVLSHLGLDQERELARTVPGIHCVLGGHTREVIGPGVEHGSCSVHHAGDRGQYLGRVRFRVGPRGPGGEPAPVARIGAEAIELPETLPEDAELQEKVAEYQRWVNIPHPPPAIEVHPDHAAAHHADETYWGASLCGPCHLKQDNFWKGTPHSHAYETLVKAGKQHDVECLRCHSTGFAQTRSRHGVKSVSDVTGLESVQCESCHGPGSRHSTDAIRFGAARAETCTRCHDPKNSPGFQFETWLPRMRCPAGS